MLSKRGKLIFSILITSLFFTSFAFASPFSGFWNKITGGVTEEIGSNCIDSDGGLEIYTAGTSGNKSLYYTEHCFNESLLNEAKCGDNNEPGWYSTYCDYGCFKGACISPSNLETFDISIAETLNVKGYELFLYFVGDETARFKLNGLLLPILHKGELYHFSDQTYILILDIIFSEENNYPSAVRFSILDENSEINNNSFVPTSSGINDNLPQNNNLENLDSSTIKLSMGEIFPFTDKINLTLMYVDDNSAKILTVGYLDSGEFDQSIETFKLGELVGADDNYFILEAISLSSNPEVLDSVTLRIYSKSDQQKDNPNFCSGCLGEKNICYPLGYRLKGNFCTSDLEFKSQLKADSSCENNFECKSNLCVSGKCLSQNFIDKILSFFKNLFKLNKE